MRGDRISVRAIATRWRMPPESWLRILVRVALHVEADLGDPLARPLAPLAPRPRRGTRGRRPRCPRRCGCRTTCSPETPCCDRRPGRATGLPPTSTVPVGGRMVRPQPGDEPQHGGLAAARRPENRDELALVRAGPAPRSVTSRMTVSVAEPLRDVPELDDVGAAATARRIAHVIPRRRGRETGRAGTRTAAGRCRRRAGR